MLAPGVLAFLFILVDASDKDEQYDVCMSGLLQCVFFPICFPLVNLIVAVQEIRGNCNKIVLI